MNEVIQYIFKSLGNTEYSIRKLRKASRAQRYFNCTVVMLATATATRMVIQDVEIFNLKNELKRLNLKNNAEEATER